MGSAHGSRQGTQNGAGDDLGGLAHGRLDALDTPPRERLSSSSTIVGFRSTALGAGSTLVGRALDGPHSPPRGGSPVAENLDRRTHQSRTRTRTHICLRA